MDEQDRRNKKLENYAININTTNDNAEESSQGGIISGAKNLAGGLNNFGKKIVKAIKFFAKLPTPVKIIIITMIVALFTTIIIAVLADEARAEVSKSVDSTVSSIKQKIQDENISDEEKESLTKSIEFFEKNNSYLYFRLSEINDACSNFSKGDASDKADIGNKTHESLLKVYGQNEINDTNNNLRVVNSDDKVPLYTHMLMTEKYNFNKTYWLWFGHGHNDNGDKINDTDMEKNLELGLKYPNDGKTKIETFINLLSPYLQTWHIPLAFHSGFVTKSGNFMNASLFTYSTIKNTYSDIVAHRYDIQKYTLNTKFKDYYERVYKSKFRVKIKATKIYKPQMKNTTNKQYNNTFKQTNSNECKFTKQDGNLTNYIAISTASSSSNVNLKDLENNSGNTAKFYYSDDTSYEAVAKACAEKFNKEVYHNTLYEWKSDCNTTFASVNTSGTYKCYELKKVQIDQRDGEYPLKYGKSNTVYKYIIEVRLYDITVNESQEYETDSEGKYIIDVYYKYEYLDKEIFGEDETLISNNYINERTADGYTYSQTENIDPMKEEFVSDSTTVTNKYYVKDAKTFDVKIANEFNYIKYNETDAANRKNPKSERETNLEDYYEIFNEENKITSQNIGNYLNSTNTLNDLELNLDLTVKQNQFKDSNLEMYNIVKDKIPNVEFSVNSINLDSLPTPLEREYIFANNIYENNKEYKIHIGKADGSLGLKTGIHYITRIWEDILTQVKSETNTYSIEDLKDYNAKYNSKKAGTKESDEKTAYEDIIKKCKTSYGYYQAIEGANELNNIIFMNSNKSIFSDYLTDVNEQSDIMGYNLEWFKLPIDELKKLFKETQDKNNGTLPYVYGTTLGFSKLSNTQPSTTTTVGGIGLLRDVSISEQDFINCVQSYSAAISKGQGTQVYRDNAKIVYDTCKKNNINPVWCSAQAWNEQNWKAPSTSPYNYWGIAVYNGQNSGSSYNNMEEAVQNYCDLMNSILSRDKIRTGGVDYGAVAAEYSEVNKKFSNNFTSLYDAFSAYCSPDTHEDGSNINYGSGDKPTTKESADHVEKYVDNILNIVENIFPNYKINLGTTSSVVDFAMNYLGQNGSEFGLFDYESKCGATDSWWADEWCAMFVSFCYDNNGLIPNPLKDSFALCKTGYNQIITDAQRRDSNYIPNSGDIIFFDWDGTHNPNNAHHVGLVVSCDGNKVYTIEGNTNGSSYSTTEVAQHEYDLNYNCILGYGDMSQ